MWRKWNQENARPHISRIIQAGVYDLDFDADGTPVFAQFVPKQIKLANPDALTKRTSSLERIGPARLGWTISMKMHFRASSNCKTDGGTRHIRHQLFDHPIETWPWNATGNSTPL